MVKLTIVDNSATLDAEFAPLPDYQWDERPQTLPLDIEECATAIHIAEGHLPRAASLLKVPLYRLKRLLRASPRLQRVFEEAASLIVDRAFSKYIEALESPEARRQEWGASAIMRSRAAQGHIFAPAPASDLTTSADIGAREIVFRWRTDADDAISTTYEKKAPDDAG